MEDTLISLDLFPIILEYCDYNTLKSIQKVNYFCYRVAFKEEQSRLKSIYPFGEKNAKIKVIVKDIIIEKIICILEDKEIEIPESKYAMYYVSDILRTWFLYSFNCNKWILTGKIIKSIIRLINKNEVENMGEILIFEFKDSKSYLAATF